MTQIKLRGLKLLEGSAQVLSFYPYGDNFLASNVCSLMALNKINITFLAYVLADETMDCGITICTEGSVARSSASLIEAYSEGTGKVTVQEDVVTISTFPHNQRPQVTSGLLETLAKKEIALMGLASSPSAISSVVLSTHTKAVIDACFETFEFPAYRSPSDWYAAYEGKENLLQKIIASYQEKVVTIYDIVRQLDLDLWNVMLSAACMEELSAFLMDLEYQGAKMPFVVALPFSENNLCFSVCFPKTHATEIRTALSRHFSTTTISHHPGVAALFIHGPHFGDRYGIAHTLVSALEKAGVTPLAMGCAVSSLSVVLKEKDLARAVQALDANFQRSSTKRA